VAKCIEKGHPLMRMRAGGLRTLSIRGARFCEEFPREGCAVSCGIYEGKTLVEKRAEAPFTKRTRALWAYGLAASTSIAQSGSPCHSPGYKAPEHHYAGGWLLSAYRPGHFAPLYGRRLVGHRAVRHSGFRAARAVRLPTDRLPVGYLFPWHPASLDADRQGAAHSGAADNPGAGH
jgi:hypothetical protein